MSERVASGYPLSLSCESGTCTLDFMKLTLRSQK